MTQEQVVEALERCTQDPSYGTCAGCPYEGVGDTFAKCCLALMFDCLDLLKAQEPRVMKVGDVRKWVNSDRVTREPVVIEIRGGVCAWIIDDEVRELPGEANLSSDLYGKTWRCWTSRPSDEVRRVTPWE